jgi:hypothetical protein
VGYAVFEFDVPGTIVNTSAGGWDPAIETYIKVNGTWVRAETPYIKQGGIWYPVNGYAPVFGDVPGRFGSSPRASEIDPPPAPPPPTPRFSGGRGGWEPSFTPTNPDSPTIGCPNTYGGTISAPEGTSPAVG